MSSQGAPLICSSSGSVNAEIIDDKVPLWKFVKKIRKQPTGGCWEWQCSFCKSTYNGSYTRVRTHLLHEGTTGIARCTKISNEAHAEMSVLVRICKERMLSAGHRQAASSSSMTRRSSHEVSTQDLLERLTEEKERLARDYARCVKLWEATSKENELLMEKIKQFEGEINKLQKVVCQQKKLIQKLQSKVKQREEEGGRVDSEDVEGEVGEGTYGEDGDTTEIVA